MHVPAARLLHVVVLMAEELDEQLGRERECISFAVDRGVDSPGLGRVAVVVTKTAEGEVVISHIGLIKSGRARTHLDAIWVLSGVRELVTPIRLSDLFDELGQSAEVVRWVASQRRGGSLPAAASKALRSAIRSRLGSGEWPSEDGLPAWMPPRLDGELRQDHTNALGTALMFSDMELSPMRRAPLPGQSPLAELRVGPSEASLIDNDLRNFPGMTADPQRLDIVRFKDREHTLDVMNVNATGIESATGVDLIYFSHDYDCFVMVQYKRMEADAGRRIAAIDARLSDQLQRMIAFDVLGQASAEGTNPSAYRLGPISTFTKFAYPVVSPVREADLTRGLYVPSKLLMRLHDGGQLKGPRGGAAVTHANLGRWLSNDQFAELVKKGWVGSSGLSVQDVREYVSARQVLPCPAGCPFEPIDLDQVATLLIQASLPPEFTRPQAVAIDGTDVESFARAHEPHLDTQGRKVYSFDRDARWGHRTGTNRRPTEHFFGYEAHIATYAPKVGGSPVPQVAAGLALRPGVRDRTAACLNIVDAVPTFTEILLDRGYTLAKGTRLARPLRDRDITLTMDLHKTQRVVRPGPAAGMLWVDGTLYSSALPEPLRTLEPPEPGMTAGEKARRREAFDAREPYRFVAHGKRNTKRGTQRFRGPAVDGHPFKVRCPNTPASMRMPHTIPTTICVQGEPCGCGATVTVADSELERDRQNHPWQSTRWALSFNRRSLVEGIIGANRFQNLNVNRGFLRQTGLVATGMLLAVTLIGHNLVRLHAWHTVRGRPEPWQVHLGEPIDDRPLDKATRTRGRRKPIGN